MQICHILEQLFDSLMINWQFLRMVFLLIDNRLTIKTSRNDIKINLILWRLWQLTK